MKVIILTYTSGVRECIPYTLDALDWLQLVISDVEDLEVFEVQKIVHESTEKITYIEELTPVNNK